ncbi:CAP domain-containing protein [Comamonas sp. w2-DMI]|uniref:CAP domain-containing protein n=1 Tax=Comamonas sp. w2-DMI TaxID=3126391 RepID=UPI0032E522C4
MKHYQSLSIIAFAALLAACGGGGGDSKPDTNNPPVTEQPGPSQPDNGQYPTETKPADYKSLNQAAIYETINKYRTTCGFSSIKQNSLLDTAAMGHANYEQINSEVGHTQTNTKPGFTGATTPDRLKAAGYAYSNGGEIVGAWVGGTMVAGSSGNAIEHPIDAPTGKALINRLFSTVYHLKSALEEWNEMGIGYSVSDNRATAPGQTSFFATAVVDFANAAGSQAPTYTAGKIRSFPCQGIDGVSPIFTAENPNPFPAIDFNQNPMGTPIYFQAGKGGNMVIEQAEIMDMSTQSIVPITNLTTDTDPQKSVKFSEGFVIPTQPLKSNTEYRVKVSGTSDMEKFTSEFVFKTGTQN